MTYNGWFTHGFHKTRKTETPLTQSSYTLHMAKNGGDCCQFVLQSQTSCTVQIKIEPLRHTSGTELIPQLSEVRFLSAGTHGEWPDPLAPLSENIPLEDHVPLSIFVRVNAPAEVCSGTYEGTLCMTIGGETQRFALTAQVWDFTLPETPSCKTSFGLDKPSIECIHHVEPNSEESDRLYRAYYETLLSKKISSCDLPVDILAPEADAYLDDPRMTSFVIPYEEDDVLQSRYLAKVRSKAEWFSKGVFYPVDEPSTRESYEKLRIASDRLQYLEPNARIVVPFYSNPQCDIRKYAVEEMMGRVRIWCPESCLFDDINMWDRVGRVPDNTLAAKLKLRQNTGESLWWYVCCGPGEPYCNLFIPMAGLCHRLLFWQQQSLGIEGFLYWSANFWRAKTPEAPHLDGTSDPWTDMATMKQINPNMFGDGSLLYNGNVVGIDGPVSSLRLEAVADGIDDFEYLTIAQRVLGREKTKAFIKQVSASLTDYTNDEDLFTRVRTELGNTIEHALKTGTNKA